MVSRPHNWKPKGTAERLLELDMMTGTDDVVCPCAVFNALTLAWLTGRQSVSDRACSQSDASEDVLLVQEIS